MFIVGQFILAISKILNWILWIYMWILVAHAVISWVGPDPHNPIVQFLNRLTEPVLRRVRRLVPIPGPFDFSPLVVILGVVFLLYFVVGTLEILALKLRYWH